MFRRAEKLNLDRNSEQVSKNLVYKVLGRRGERVFRQVELRERETVNTEGRVVMLEQEVGRDSSSPRRGEKRTQRSPGNSPPARRAFGGRRGTTGERI